MQNPLGLVCRQLRLTTVGIGFQQDISDVEGKTLVGERCFNHIGWEPFFYCLLFFQLGFAWWQY